MTTKFSSLTTMQGFSKAKKIYLKLYVERGGTAVSPLSVFTLHPQLTFYRRLKPLHTKGY